MKIQVTKILFFILPLILAIANGQNQRPRTRLELMFDDIVYNMGNVASRINHALFAETPPRRRPRPSPTPLPPQKQAFQEGNINSIPELMDVPNEIEFESSRQTEDNFFAPNSPHARPLSSHEALQYQQHAPNSPHAHDPYQMPAEHLHHGPDSSALGTEDYQRQNFAPHQQQQFEEQQQQLVLQPQKRPRRPRPPPRAPQGGGFGDIRTFVNRAMHRVRNMWPANRRRNAANY